MPVYLTFALAFLGFVSLNAARVVLSLYALSLGAQPFAVGVLAAMFYVFPLLLSWLVGTLTDRFGSRWLLLFGTACGAIGLLVPYFSRELSALYVAAAMSGLSLAFYNVIVQNLVGILSKPHERIQSFSNFSLVGATANFVGPLIAGFSIDHSGYPIACLYIVALSIGAGAMLVAWGGVLPGGNKHHAGAATRVLDALADREIRQMLVTSGLVQVGFDLFQFYMPIYGHALGLSASVIGAVLSTFAVASFVVRLAMPRLIARLGEERLLEYSFYLGAASFMLVPLCRNPLMLGLISFAFGLGMGCGQPLTLMLMFSRSPEGRSGETLGLRLTANNIMRVIGPAFFGSIGSMFGLFPVFWISAIMMGSGGVRSRTKHGPAGK